MTETLSAVLPEDIEATVHNVLQAACDGKLSFSTAESCTGGLIASVLTDVDGCGRAFERGFVVYTEAAKSELLGVAGETLRIHGAVSRETAIAMAEGALSRSSADIAVAVTGYAGPGGPESTPGLVHFAVACRNGRREHRVELFPDPGRGAVRLAALRTAIEMLGAAVGSYTGRVF